MKFETHKLEGILNTYIESIFHFEDFRPDHSIERVIPTGHIYMIFELDHMVRHTYENDTLTIKNAYKNVWISGNHKNYISISAHQDSEMFVIQFKPYGAYPFFQIPMYELNDRVIPAENVFGNEVIQLRNILLKQPAVSGKFIAAETWLLQKYNAQKTPPHEFLEVLQKLSTESVANFSTIMDSYSKSHKHLIDQFKKYVGITPKYFQRILRFNEILQHIHKSEKIEWSQIAYQCEYSDQSHFIKEFKHFSGVNPQKFIVERFHQDEGRNFFPLDREG